MSRSIGVLVPKMQLFWIICLGYLSLPLQAGTEIFFYQEPSSTENLQNNAYEMFKAKGESSWIALIENAQKDEASGLDPLLKALENLSPQNEALACYALIASGVSSPKFLKMIAARLDKSWIEARKGSENQLAGSSAASSMLIAISLGRKAAPLRSNIAKFLESPNFHDVYWALDALGSMRENAKESLAEIIKVTTHSVNFSVKRHGLLALGTIGESIGEEGLQTLATSLEGIHSEERRAAIIALINLGAFVPQSLKEKLVQLEQKQGSTHSLELAVAKAVLMNDAEAINEALSTNLMQLPSSQSGLLFFSYITFLKTDALVYEDEAAQLLENEDLDIQAFGADLVFAMEAYASVDILARAEEIYEKQNTEFNEAHLKFLEKFSEGLE